MLCVGGEEVERGRTCCLYFLPVDSVYSIVCCYPIDRELMESKKIPENQACEEKNLSMVRHRLDVP
jgi:hypothetical protein